MIIEVNYNSDEITIEENSAKKLTWKIKEPNKVLNILEEIFNAIDFHGAHETINIQLNKVDEDTKITIGEW